MLKHFFISQDSAGLFARRAVYYEGAKEGTAVETQKGSEKAEATPADVDQARARFQKEKDALVLKIQEYLKSDNPAIKKAAEEANKSVAVLDSAERTLTPEMIQRQLDTIQLTLAFFEKKKKLDEQSKKVREMTERVRTEWTNQLSKMSEEYIATNALYLTYEQVDAIRKMAARNEEAMYGAVEVYELAGSMNDEDLTLEDHFLDPGKIDRVLERGKEVLLTLDSAGNPLDFNLRVLYNETQQYCEGQVCVAVAKDVKKAEEYANALRMQEVPSDTVAATYETPTDESASDEESAAGEYDISSSLKELIDDVVDNALATLALLSKPADAPQRALVLATLKDQVDALRGEQLMVDSKKSPEEQPTLTQATRRQLGLKPDKYFAGFEKAVVTDADPGLDLTEKANDTRVRYTTIGTPSFRLEGSGAKIMTLSANSELQIVDPKVLVVDTGDGKKVHYLKVRVGGSEGPVGYVAQNHINFQSMVVDEHESIERTTSMPA